MPTTTSSTASTTGTTSRPRPRGRSARRRRARRRRRRRRRRAVREAQRARARRVGERHGRAARPATSSCCCAPSSTSARRTTPTASATTRAADPAQPHQADYLFDLKSDPFEQQPGARGRVQLDAAHAHWTRALQIAQEQVKRRYDGSHLLGGMSTEAEAARRPFSTRAAGQGRQERATPSSCRGAARSKTIATAAGARWRDRAQPEGPRARPAPLLSSITPPSTTSTPRSRCMATMLAFLPEVRCDGLRSRLESATRRRSRRHTGRAHGSVRAETGQSERERWCEFGTAGAYRGSISSPCALDLDDLMLARARELYRGLVERNDPNARRRNRAVCCQCWCTWAASLSLNDLKLDPSSRAVRVCDPFLTDRPCRRHRRRWRHRLVLRLGQ